MSTPRPRWRVRFAKMLAFPLVWTLLGGFFGVRAALVGAYAGGYVGFDRTWVSIGMSLLEWWGWGILALAAIALKKTPLGSWSDRRWSFVLHIPISLVISVLKMNFDMTLFRRVFGFIPGVYFVAPIDRIFANIVTYWSIFAAFVGLNYYQKYRERQLRATQLEAKLLDARLNALKMQLHPHFLFNTLNAISTLMHR